LSKVERRFQQMIHNNSGELANSRNEYVSGVYYVVKTIPRPSGVSEVLPDTLLTLSSCFATVISDIVQLCLNHLTRS